MQYTISQSEPASSQAAAAIRAMIISGEILDGARINEVHIAEKLKISRTPVREGLGQLMTESFVEIIPRRGFFACKLTESEFGDLYDLRPILDPHALQISALPSDAEIDRLEEANRKFLDATNYSRSVEADMHFHKLLLERCPNAVLLGLIEELTERTLRYELALFRETQRLPAAGNEHAQIIRALRDRDIDRAADALRRNLTSGKEPILRWLSARDNIRKEHS